MTRLAWVACAAAALLLALAGCGGGSGSGGGKTGGSATATPSSHKTGATPTPSWRSKYTAAQLKQYDTAVAFWHKYQKAAAPLWAAGKATPHAKALFNEYMTPPNAHATYHDLTFFQQHYERVVGQPKPLWIQPVKIEPGRVELSECVDYSKSKVTLNGWATASRFDGPVLRAIDVVNQGERQRVAVLGDPQLMKMGARPCSPAS